MKLFNPCTEVIKVDDVFIAFIDKNCFYKKPKTKIVTGIGQTEEEAAQNAWTSFIQQENPSLRSAISRYRDRKKILAQAEIMNDLLKAVAAKGENNQ